MRAPLTDLDTCGCPPANVTQLLDGEAIGSGSQGYQKLQPKFLRALHQACHRKLPELSDLLAQNLPKVVR